SARSSPLLLRPHCISGAPLRSLLLPYTTLFRSALGLRVVPERHGQLRAAGGKPAALCRCVVQAPAAAPGEAGVPVICSEYGEQRSEEHTSELQSRFDLVCRLLLETKNRPEAGLS